MCKEMVIYGLIFLMLLGWSCTSEPPHVVKVSGKNIDIYFNEMLYSQIRARFDQKIFTPGDFAPSEFIKVSGKEISDFKFVNQQKLDVKDHIGSGTVTVIKGDAGSVQKRLK